MTCLVTTFIVKPSEKHEFIKWQGWLNGVLASFPGFLSLEISSSGENSWVIVQRFNRADDLVNWQKSIPRMELLNQLATLIAGPLQEIITGSFYQGGVTEVLVTKVTPEKEQEFKSWIAKMHLMEAKFPGFKGVYIQSPKVSGQHWITLLQFDTVEHLDNWLESNEREEILKESKDLIGALESHRVISPFAGWFSSIQDGAEKVIPIWKQTMIVLLVLYPIVMLELRFLSPLTKSLNPSLGTFIGNAISVSLVSWPMIPLAIYFLKWWLLPDKSTFKVHIIGIIVVTILYLLEILVFWHLL